MAKKRKAQTKRELFKEGMYALSAHVNRAVDITRQDHPLREVQDICQGMEALMSAIENAADLGYALEIVALYQPALPGMETDPNTLEDSPDPFDGLGDPEIPF